MRNLILTPNEHALSVPSPRPGLLHQGACCCTPGLPDAHVKRRPPARSSWPACFEVRQLRSAALRHPYSPAPAQCALYLRVGGDRRYLWFVSSFAQPGHQEAHRLPRKGFVVLVCSCSTRGGNGASHQMHARHLDGRSVPLGAFICERRHTPAASTSLRGCSACRTSR